MPSNRPRQIFISSPDFRTRLVHEICGEPTPHDARPPERRVPRQNARTGRMIHPSDEKPTIEQNNPRIKYSRLKWLMTVQYRCWITSVKLSGPGKFTATASSSAEVPIDVGNRVSAEMDSESAYGMRINRPPAPWEWQSPLL